MNLRGVLQTWELFAGSPQAVPRLRELILQLAVQGKLVSQDPRDEPASELLKKIMVEKERLVKEGKIKQDKSLAEIAEDEQPFELPNGWKWRSLANLGEWAIGSGFPTDAQGRQGLPILFAKVSDMNLPGNERSISRTNHTIDEETVTKLRINVHPPGTVVFPKIGGAIATNKRRILIRPTAIDNNCLGITPSLAVSSEYLLLLLTSIDFTAYQAGTSVPALSQGTIGQIPVALPPLAEQSRIVTRVQELMQLCDALEAKVTLEAQQHETLLRTLLATLTQSASSEDLAQNWQRVSKHFPLLLDRPAAIDALEQTILQLAVRGLLVPQNPKDEPASQLLKKIRAEKDKLILEGKIKRDKPLPPIAEDEQPFELPKGWEWTRLGDVAVIASGVTLGRKTSVPCPVSLPYLRVANVQRWHLNMTSIKEVVIDQSELQRFRLQNGDLLIIEGGDWDKVGRTAIWRDEIATCLHQNHVLRARGTSADWNPIWAELFLNSAVARAYFETAAKQTTNLASINMTQLKNCAFPLPPLPEQHRIVTRVTELRQLCAALRSSLAQSSQIQAQLAQALVSQAA